MMVMMAVKLALVIGDPGHRPHYHHYRHHHHDLVMLDGDGDDDALPLLAVIGQ